MLLLSACAGSQSDAQPISVPAQSAATEPAENLLTKYSDMPLSGEGIGIGAHDDEFGFHIVNKIEFTHPRAYSSAHIAHSYQVLTNEKLKTAYDMIIDACYCFSDEKVDADCNYKMRPVFLSGTDYYFKDIESAIIAVFDDHPEIFWMDYLFDLDFDYKANITVLTLRSLYTADEVMKMMGKIDAALVSFFDGMPSDLSAYEREVYVYKYLIDHCEYDDHFFDSDEYDDEHPSLFNLYGTLVDHSAVCEGYAYTFDYLCSELGIDTVCICGYVNTDDDPYDTLHLWNAVLLDDEWYMADVTWDDPDEDEDIRDVFVYLNIPQSVMELDHELDKTYAQITEEEYFTLDCYINNFLPPTCTAADYCYYMRESVRLSEPDVDLLSEGIVKAAQNHASALMVYVDSDSYTLEEMSRALFDGNQPYYEAMEKANAALGKTQLDVNAVAVYYHYDNRNLIAFEMPYQ